MAKRKYKLSDVYDYLLRFYNLEWRLYQIKDFDTDYNGNERGIRSWDLKTDYIWKIALVYQNNKRKDVSLKVSNDKLEVYEVNPYMHHYDKPDREGKEFLDRRYGQEKNTENEL